MELQELYIEVPEWSRESVKYDYYGNPDGKQSYQFFDNLPTVMEMSSKEIGLDAIMKSNIVQRHFEGKGFATKWKPGRYMLAPWVATNIYKGALGEQAGEAILTRLGFHVEPMPKGLEERFDAVISLPGGEKAFVDFKYWMTARDNKDGAEDKIEDMLSGKYGIRKLIYINVFDLVHAAGSESKQIIGATPDNRVIEVPGLIHMDGSVIVEHVDAVREFLS
ncbi:hypothetical protein NX722_23640 [Endozoicomonas gorgoniicola]|uniref:Restriction endonuclease n=1 Tax=Endozoicomonas gorgoniicola TaxID=1234144 RepID=A0ABT3N1R5_9GAMM|nr:hypothetical protein [Endozoicomonas gorgoniicola]MCW7555561.1 hypothetical protein [Endozoicomonas gorgoniicola]